MSFVNEWITTQDRTRYRLSLLDYQNKATDSPARYWTIDRDTDTFLRLLKPYARKQSPHDSDAVFEKDFQFCWHDTHFRVATRALRDVEWPRWDGVAIDAPAQRPWAGVPLSFYIYAIDQIDLLSPSGHLVYTQSQQPLLRDLQQALATSWGGAGMFMTEKSHNLPRYARLKLGFSV